MNPKDSYFIKLLSVINFSQVGGINFVIIEKLLLQNASLLDIPGSATFFVAF